MTLLSDGSDLDIIKSNMNNKVKQLFEDNSSYFNVFNLLNYNDATIRALIRVIKISKVIYIPKSTIINNIIKKYIEIISSILNTYVVYDEFSDNDPNFRKPESPSNEDLKINNLLSKLNDGVLNDHILISNSRYALCNYTLIQKNSFTDILNSKLLQKQTIKVSAVITTMRKSNLEKILNYIDAQENVEVEIILLTHGFELDSLEREYYSNLTSFPITFLSQEARVAYGECLNICIDNMSYDYFAKIDDDDVYYPSYLLDAYLSLKYSESALVGKHCTHWYFEKENFVAERFLTEQNKYTSYIAGATVFSTKETIAKYKFSPLTRRVDSDLLERVIKNNKKIYCNHSYEFCVFRNADLSTHTWRVDSLYILRSSVIKFFGNPDNSISVKNTILEGQLHEG